jgi:hypothetical protein
VRATGLVRDPLHDGPGDERTQVVKFGSARLGETTRYGPDRAVVKVNAKVAIVDRFEVGEVTLFVKHRGKNGDMIVDGLSGESIFGIINQLTTATIEYTIDQSGLLCFHVFKKLDRQGIGRRREQRLSECRGLIPVSRATCASVILVRHNEPSRAKRSKVLPHSTRRYLERGCEFVRGDFAVPLHYFEHVPLSWRQVNDDGHICQR